MFVTPLNIEQVLDRFYNQSKYDLMLIFVSSFDGNDRTILKEIVDNAKRIDRITGERICFFYFIKDAYDGMNEKLVRWVKDISDWEPLYGEGVSVTMETADDICLHFGLLRSTLPAFILVGKDKRKDSKVFTIRDYNDFESFLTPINIIHSYVEDRDNILDRYDSEKRCIITEYNTKRRRTVVTQYDVDKRKADRLSWEHEIKRLTSRKDIELSRGEIERAKRRAVEIENYKKKLSDYPEIVICGEDENVIYPQEQLDNLYYPQDKLNSIQRHAVERLNLALNSHEGEHIIQLMQDKRGYPEAVLLVWNIICSRGIRLSRILEKIRFEIHEKGFDIFISCKSQDYASAHNLFDFLVSNGYKPFLADTSIKEVGIDQYTALIGEVINVCQNMIVFATDIDYIETPYVAAEWHTFVNDINTGRKPNAKLINVLAPNIDVHYLPAWLRDKQCLTTENYKDDLLQFLKGLENSRALQLREKVQDAYAHYRNELDCLTLRSYNREIEWPFYDFSRKIEREKEYLDEMLHKYEISYNPDEKHYLQNEIETIIKHWDDKFCQLEKINEQNRRNEEETWYEATRINSVEGFQRYLGKYPRGIYAEDAFKRIHSMMRFERENIVDSPISYFPSRFSNFISDGQPSKSYYYSNFWDKVLNRKTYKAYSSIFAPAEVQLKSHLIVQVYIHLLEETEDVKDLAQESDKNAERRDYVPLQCKLKKGDKVDVLLNIYGKMLLMSEKQSIVWQGSFTKCSFGYFVPNDIDADELSCVALLTVNEIPVGEMRFITKIVDKPRQLNTEIIALKFNKVFISYSHLDEERVKFYHEGLELANVPHFFDRSYLKAGDVFPQVIQNYINSADLFILFWSENASKSEYVEKERKMALERAFPQVKPQQAAKLSIYPMSIEPRAELPGDMKENYHFGEI